MKKATSPKGRRQKVAELLGEYSFDYSQSQPNRFAGKVDQDRVVVVLDPDIADVFKSSEDVNRVLRALIANMPQSAPRKRARPASNSS